MSVKKNAEHYTDWISNFSPHRSQSQRLKTNNLPFYAFSFLLLSLSSFSCDLICETKKNIYGVQVKQWRERIRREWKVLRCRFAYFTWLIFAIGRNWRQLTAKDFHNTKDVALADIDFYVADNLISPISPRPPLTPKIFILFSFYVVFVLLPLKYRKINQP